MPPEKESAPAVPISLKEFFESTPPGTWAVVGDVAEPPNHFAPPNSVSRRPKTSKLPDLRLHCDKDSCGGTRNFYTSAELELKGDESKQLFVSYFCRNCRASVKTFAIVALRRSDDKEAHVFKYGEDPAFGPPLPSKLISLVRPEWEYFVKGRRAENQGLGIGAFAYYRRVIESQKDRILDELIRAAKKLAAHPDLINELEQVKRNIQFKNAIEGMKQGMPPALLIEGTNPLTLLHSALSIGLHGESDEECLAAATDIRLVMAELAERLASVLKEHSELKQSVARLLQKNNSSRDRE